MARPATSGDMTSMYKTHCISHLMNCQLASGSCRVTQLDEGPENAQEQGETVENTALVTLNVLIVSALTRREKDACL